MTVSNLKHVNRETLTHLPPSYLDKLVFNLHTSLNLLWWYILKRLYFLIEIS